VFLNQYHSGYNGIIPACRNVNFIDGYSLLATILALQLSTYNGNIYNTYLPENAPTVRIAHPSTVLLHRDTLPVLSEYYIISYVNSAPLLLCLPFMLSIHRQSGAILIPDIAKQWARIEASAPKI
jgi:hypothetical protein